MDSGFFYAGVKDLTEKNLVTSSARFKIRLPAPRRE